MLVASLLIVLLGLGLESEHVEFRMDGEELMDEDSVGSLLLLSVTCCCC